VGHLGFRFLFVSEEHNSEVQQRLLEKLGIHCRNSLPTNFERIQKWFQVIRSRKPCNDSTILRKLVVLPSSDHSVLYPSRRAGRCDFHSGPRETGSLIF
jgi:hypothetical protein